MASYSVFIFSPARSDRQCRFLWGSVRDLALTERAIRGKIGLARFQCHFGSVFSSPPVGGVVLATRSYQWPTGTQASKCSAAPEGHTSRYPPNTQGFPSLAHGATRHRAKTTQTRRSRHRRRGHHLGPTPARCEVSGCTGELNLLFWGACALLVNRNIEKHKCLVFGDCCGPVHRVVPICRFFTGYWFLSCVTKAPVVSRKSTFSTL